MSNYEVILVGEDNLTRSVIAEATLKKILEEKKISDVEVTSRGLVVLFSEPISPKEEAVLYAHDCGVAGKRSVELTQEDVDTADLILTMQKEEVDRVREKYDVQKTCMFLGTFIDMEEELPNVAEDTTEAYETCYEVTRQAMEAVADRLILELITP